MQRLRLVRDRRSEIIPQQRSSRQAEALPAGRKVELPLIEGAVFGLIVCNFCRNKRSTACYFCKKQYAVLLFFFLSQREAGKNKVACFVHVKNRKASFSIRGK